VVSHADGEAALRVARAAIETRLGPSPPRDAAAPFRAAELAPVFDERRGVFVTLKVASDGALRGCIGYPLPVLPLRTALPRVAVAAAVDDPRFPPVELGELGRLRLEVSILTPPEPIEASDAAGRLAAVLVGRDGLIVETDESSGLLLPQVAVEEGWTAEELLRATCLKAGLPASSWQSPRVHLRRFQAEVFSEGPPVEDHRPPPVTLGPGDEGGPTT
jgi:uncharacterized protein